jgi:hypothetical protein
MTDFLFDLPFWFPIAGLVLAVGVFIYGNNRSNARIRLAAAGILLLTLALLGVSYFVDTFEEKCIKRTHAIVAAVSAKDWDAVRTLMDAPTTVAGLTGPDAIANTGKRLAEELGLQSSSILSTTTKPGGSSLIDVQILAKTEFSQPIPPMSRWSFQYEQMGDGIRLSNIMPIGTDGSPQEINKRLR